jgi:K+-sensing histidine kinase KdpD
MVVWSAVRILEAEDVAAALVDFARTNSFTQIFLARTQESARFASLRRSLVQSVVNLAKDMQVVLVSPPAPAVN